MTHSARADDGGQARPSLRELRSRLVAAAPHSAAREEVGAAVAALPGRAGDVILLTTVGGYSIREAAELTGCSPRQALADALRGLEILASRPRA